MILNIRGTSGSGKSTLVRRLMDLYSARPPIKVDGRRQPKGYTLWDGDVARAVVIGHYETACGGCDTITEIDHIYELVRFYAGQGLDVIYEGLLISAEVNRVVNLAQEHPVVVLALTTPLDVCIASINERRRAKKPGAEGVDPKNTTSKHRGVQLSIARLLNAGVEVHEVSREDAYETAKLVLSRS